MSKCRQCGVPLAADASLPFCNKCLKLEKMKREDPRWQRLSQRPKCLICTRSFGLFLRRHHCRNCGSNVCGDCSDDPLHFSTSGESTAERICRLCFRGAVKTINEKTGAATKIQRNFRGSTKYGVWGENETATKIQSMFRGHKVRNEMKERNFPPSGPYKGSTNGYEYLNINIKDISENCPGWGEYYQLLGKKKGLCSGLVFMRGQAHLSNGIDIYDLRLRYLTRRFHEAPFHINGKKFNKISDIINYATEQSKTKYAKYRRISTGLGDTGKANVYNEMFTRNERLDPNFSTANRMTQQMMEHPAYKFMMSIRAFLDSLLIYHNPRKTSLYKDSKARKFRYQRRDQFNRVGPNPLDPKKDLLWQDAVASSRYIKHPKVGELRCIFNEPFAGDKGSYDKLLYGLTVASRPPCRI
jgi:hypothetical protein